VLRSQRDQVVSHGGQATGRASVIGLQSLPKSGTAIEPSSRKVNPGL
jgi:hypothetical protein